MFVKNDYQIYYFLHKRQLFTRLIQFLNHKKSREKQLGPPFLAARKRVIIPLGLLRVAALNPLFSGCVGSTDATDRPERANSLCVLPPGSPKGERQNVVIPSKNRFFDGQTGPPFLAARRASGGVPGSCLSLRDLQLTRGGERFLFLW